MRHRHWTRGALCLLATVPCGLSGQEPGELGIAVGSTPEAVVIEDLSGGEASLGDYIGKGPAIIEFWATWCENCAALQPTMNAAHAEYGDRIRFVAVAVGVAQSVRRVRRHLEDHPLPYPVLWDGGGRAVRAFLAPATSYVVALDARGVVTYTGIGPEQDIAEAAKSALGG